MATRLIEWIREFLTTARNTADRWFTLSNGTGAASPEHGLIKASGVHHWHGSGWMQGKRKLLFVQGGGIGVHDDWDSKMVSSLQRELGDDVDILYPRMPDEADPSYEQWKPVLVEHLGALPDDAILVAHSVGGTMLIRLLAEKVRLPALSGILVIAAPFLGDGGWSADGAEFPPDLGEKLPKDVPIHFFHGLADETVPSSHVGLYARAIPRMRVHRLPGRDHQLDNDLGEVARVISSL